MHADVFKGRTQYRKIFSALLIGVFFRCKHHKMVVLTRIVQPHISALGERWAWV